MNEPLELNGLDGANPLGFLAALGTLALCERLGLSPHMAWRPYANSYRPVLSVSDATDLSEKLTDLLKRDFADKPPAWCEGTIIKRLANDYRSFALIAAKNASPECRHEADFAAAFASEVIMKKGKEKEQLVQETAISFSNGQGNQYLLQFYRDMIDALTVDQLKQALSSEWKYTDTRPTFRWDPADARSYAFLAANPGTNPSKTVRAGNALAFWGLIFLPSFPLHNELATVGFGRMPKGRQSTALAQWYTWPLWCANTVPNVVRSLVASPLLQTPNIDARLAHQIGLLAVYRSRRDVVGQNLYFSPAIAV